MFLELGHVPERANTRPLLVNKWPLTARLVFTRQVDPTQCGIPSLFIGLYNRQTFSEASPSERERACTVH